jgi:hypothetical protein
MLTQKRNTSTFGLQILRGECFENVILTKQVQLLANAAYAIAITALWNGELLSAESKQTVKQFIKIFLLKSEDRQQAYTVLVERIQLARGFVIVEQGRAIPAPEVWFRETNSKGFAVTAKWWKTLRETRESFPLFRQYMKVVAEAVVDILETPTPKNFHYWRLYFIEREWQGPLNLFLAVIANMRFGEEGEL